MSAPACTIAFADGARAASSFGDVRFYRQPLGELYLPSGQIAACDPYVDPEVTPFARAVPSGRYPVDLAVARFDGDGDERVAAARVRFGVGEPARWEVAVTGRGGRDDGGYGVDSARGCLASAEALAVLAAQRPKGDEYAERIGEAMERSYRHTREWANVVLDDESGLNLVVFSTGLGDGFYVSFWGLDGAGRPACLVTDFGIVDEE
jgi:hypothetical protein